MSPLNDSSETDIAPTTAEADLGTLRSGSFGLG